MSCWVHYSHSESLNGSQDGERLQYVADGAGSLMRQKKAGESSRPSPATVSMLSPLR